MKSKANIDYRLYLISDRDILQGRDFIGSLEQAILGGVTVIQLREKEASSLEFYRLAVKVKALTAKHDIPLIINDRLDIALAVEADGVHVGQSDMPAQVVRDIIGADKIVGVSTSNMAEVKKATADGADYVGVGALFPTTTKEATRFVTLDQLKAIKNDTAIPIVGIGGINETNIGLLADTQIDGCAVVSAILGKEDIQQAAKNLITAF